MSTILTITEGGLEYTTQLDLQDVFSSCLKVAPLFRFSCIPEKESCLEAKAFSTKLKSLPLKTVERICTGRK